MKLTEAKKAGDVKLEGITTEIVKKDSNVVRVILRDQKGNFVEIAKDGYSDLDVLVPAPKETKTVYHLTGTVVGLPVSTKHDYEHEAEEAKRKIVSEVPAASETLKVEPIQVEVEQ